MNPFTHYSSNNQSQWSEARKVSLEEPSIFTFENYGDDCEDSFHSSSQRYSIASSHFSNQHDSLLSYQSIRNHSFSSSFISNQSGFLNDSINDLKTFDPTKFPPSAVDPNEPFIEGAPRNQIIDVTAMTYDRYIDLATRGLVLGAIQELHQTQKDARKTSSLVDDASSYGCSDSEFEKNDEMLEDDEDEFLSESLYDGTRFKFLKKPEEQKASNVQDEELLLF